MIRRLTPPRKGDDLDGNGNARRCEVVRLGARRDRPCGTTAASTAALNSTAGSSFGDPRGPAARAVGMPATDETVPKTAVSPGFRTLYLSAGSASARRLPEQQVFGGRPKPRLSFVSKLFNLDKTALPLSRRVPPRFLDGLVKDQACQRKSVTMPKRVSPLTPVLRQLGQKTIDLGRVAA